jgi:myo-inositol-1-phosphate synthase
MSIRVAIVGVGNCANSFMQGLQHYRGVNDSKPVLGLVRPFVGGYHVKDIEVVAAFDVVEGKVGKDLAEAMWAYPNDTFRFADVPNTGYMVRRGPTLDGRGKYIKQEQGAESSEEPLVQWEVVQILKEAGVDVLLNYLPVGSQAATEFYVGAALEAKCAVVNCIPVFLASNPTWADRFTKAGLPIIGDDIKSQVGATIVHRVLARLFHERGVQLDRTYQLNIGGNSDFLNMLERERLESKKTSKTEAVISVSGTPIEGSNVHIGPSDYVKWLGDRKFAYIRLEGRGFGGAPLEAEMKLTVWDSPNSAGIVIDAVRCAALAMDRGLSGPIREPSACFMKRPAEQVEDHAALEQLEAWLDDGH